MRFLKTSLRGPSGHERHFAEVGGAGSHAVRAGKGCQGHENRARAGMVSEETVGGGGRRRGAPPGGGAGSGGLGWYVTCLFNI